MKSTIELTYVQEPLRPCDFASLRFSFLGVFMRAIMTLAGIAVKREGTFSDFYVMRSNVKIG
jgi:hypothetical protein